jgi:hypothetical protein
MFARRPSDSKIDIFPALDPFGSYLKSPRDDQRDGEADCDQCNDEANDPSWNLEKWKNLRRNLDEQPADNRISNRNFVYVAPR